MKETIRDFPSMKILGYVETKPDGVKIATNFHNTILGYYYPSRDETTDFMNRVVAHGDCVVSLIYKDSAM